MFQLFAFSYVNQHFQSRGNEMQLPARAHEASPTGLIDYTCYWSPDYHVWNMCAERESASMYRCVPCGQGVYAHTLTIF